MLEFRNVTKTYDGVNVLKNLSLQIADGEKVALMGESGSGKTTVLRIAAGLTKPDSGTVIQSGNLAVMFQEPRLLPWKTAIENIYAVLRKESYELADQYLAAVGLSDAADKLPRELSGGMAQRVALARFLAFAEATEANLLLLDEPFSALDSETEEKMTALLKGFAENRTLLLVTHNEYHAENLGARVLNLKNID